MNPVLNGGYASPQGVKETLTIAATNQTRAKGHHPVGTRGALPDGRVFYYASNGAVALTPGSLLIALALTRSSSHDKTPLTSSFANWATGKKEGILLDNTDVNADIITNEYQDGFLWYENAAGQAGHVHKIRGHSSADSSVTSTTLGAKFDLFEPLLGTAVATDELSFVRNPWDRVVTSSTSDAELVVGVAPRDVAASTALATDVTTTEAATNTVFFWAQTWGPAAVEIDDTTVAIGISCTSGDTADQVKAAVTGTFVATSGTVATVQGATVGVGMGEAVAGGGDFGMVFLKIAA